MNFQKGTEHVHKKYGLKFLLGGQFWQIPLIVLVKSNRVFLLRVQITWTCLFVYENLKLIKFEGGEICAEFKFMKRIVWIKLHTMVDLREAARTACLHDGTKCSEFHMVLDFFAKSYFVTPRRASTENSGSAPTTFNTFRIEVTLFVLLWSSLLKDFRNRSITRTGYHHTSMWEIFTIYKEKSSDLNLGFKSIQYWQYMLAVNSSFSNH